MELLLPLDSSAWPGGFGTQDGAFLVPSQSSGESIMLVVRSHWLCIALLDVACCAQRRILIGMRCEAANLLEFRDPQS